MWLRIAGFIGLVAMGQALAAESWPQFRGPGRDGRSAARGLADAWPEKGPATLWRVPLGQGYSALSVVDGRIYTLFAVGKDEFAGCFDAANGKELWRQRIDKKWNDRFGDGPRSTPTVEGDRVYVVSAGGKLSARATKDGAELWSRDLEAEYGAEPPTWGVSTSPLIEGDLLVLDVGGADGASVVALNKKTGKEAWRSQNGPAGYSAPIAVEIGGIRQLLALTGRALISLSPDDGRLYWEVPWQTSYGVNAATPLFLAPDRVFVSTGYDVGAALLQVVVADGKPTVREVWKGREMRNKFSSSVLHGGQIYGFDEKSLKCIDGDTGETRWRFRGLGHGSLIFADGKLIVLGDSGTLVLAEASPEAYVELGRAEPFDGKTWTMPTLVDGRLYLRDEKEMVALDIGGGSDE